PRRKWLITGAGGMLGTDLRDELTARGEDVVALSRNDLDITDSRCVNAAVEEHAPSIVVNCAAYTKVDLAESEESAANAINGSAVEMLAHAANEAKALLVTVSTDFVFDGTSTTPYDVTSPTRPLSAYGRSKLLGEIAATHARQHLIVRTSWLFGVHGPNFVEAIRNQIRKGEDSLRVVADQRGRPTYTPHLAQAIVRLAQMASESDVARGIVHYADEDECSWFDFARAIAEESGASIAVKPVTTDEFPRPAKRPAYSVLSTERYERLTGLRPESWREGLRDYLSLRA
ncbi:MAG TPA: dTDP-4-dehydrorhamnose reductase, partial [Thermoanaerobaculia bacterium]|nr:dTDP-4-dehydrorhamnose reductase [Thermoanaerobaculia bacterium]